MFKIFRRKRRARKILKEADFSISSQTHRDICPFCKSKVHALFMIEKLESPAGEIFRHTGSDIMGWACLRCFAVWRDDPNTKTGGKDGLKLHKLQEFIDLHRVREVMDS